MTATPTLFDRAALAAHRARAHGDLFLHHAAIDEVQDRLSLVKRSFTRMAIVSPFPTIWQSIFPGAVIVADTDVLDLKPESFDLVVHAMCLHWANDPVGQLIQCRRALVPDGFCLALLLGGQTLAELRAVLAQAEGEVCNGLSPRVAPMGEIRELGALLQRAGLTLPVADSHVLTARYRDLYHLMRDLRAMGETNALAQRIKYPTRKTMFDRANTLYADTCSDNEGITASFELICLTGWSPAPSQQQPLRPGSAQARLADALGSDEVKLPD